IWIQATIAVVVISLSNLRQQLDYLGFTLSVCAALCASLVFFLRSDLIDAKSRRWYPMAPLIYVGGTISIATLTAIRSPEQAIVGVATLLLGVVVYIGSQLKGTEDDLGQNNVEG
ncbi:MAG: hypothetical protein AAF497_29180, partial [Planctomycetota bacterium]